jgi:hypothetical protein
MRAASSVAQGCLYRISIRNLERDVIDLLKTKANMFGSVLDA